MTDPRFDAVLFDLGNVLVLHDNRKLTRALAAAAGLSPGQVSKRLDPDFIDDVHRGTIADDALHEALCRRLGKRFELPALQRLWSCHFSLNHEMLELVGELAEQLPLVLVSNTNAWHFDGLRPQLPVLGRFRELVLSHRVGLIKPEPGIYEVALEAAGTEPSRTLFVDDVPDYVAGAERLGIAGHVFTEVRRFRAFWRGEERRRDS